jgi:hypothetical protein
MYKKLLFTIVIFAFCMGAGVTQEIPEQQKPGPGPIDQKPSITAEDRINLAGKTFNGKHYEVAANEFYLAYKNSETGSEERETAQYYLGKSFIALGMTYAASEFFYETIKGGSNIDRIMDALYILQNLIEKSPHDTELLKNDLVFNMEYDFLPGDLLDFANYYKGEINFRKKLYKWANMRFSLISEDSYYFNKVKYLKAVQLLALDRVEDAMKILKDIIEDKFQDFNIKNKARQTIARLLYEQQKYPEAYDLYSQIDSPPLQQDSAFLERAWTLYFLKRYQEALGALNPLWAPLARKKSFYPEKYILKALILRAICQYTEAKATIVEFQNEYGDAIETILNREDPLKNNVLVNAAMWDTEIASRTKFIEQLEYEKKLVKSSQGKWDLSGLYEFLVRIYDLKIDETKRYIENDVLDRFKAVSNELLDYYEQIRLMEYELSLDELSRIRKAPLDVERVEPIPKIFKGRIYWPFDGEFWTDELLHFKNLIKNTCGNQS